MFRQAVLQSKAIAVWSQGMFTGRAKIIMGVVTVYNSRKVVVGCADTHSGCSVGHCGLEVRNPLFRTEKGISLFLHFRKLYWPYIWPVPRIKVLKSARRGN